RALNAWRHGMTGQVMMFTKEDWDAYLKHTNSLLASLGAAPGLETVLAKAIADDTWRLNRVSCIENTLIGIGLNTKEDPYPTQPPQVSDAFLQAFAWVKNAKNLNLLTLYESRIHRKMQRNLDLLRQEQATRIAAEKLKPQVQEVPPEPPPEFVFSTPVYGPLVNRINVESPPTTLTLAA
ncbi:MAG TPA: hypothetical protein VG456_01630, partial [Candidatus Sulfopaludibacter sp.]|nr:hypothetical protein [Candidatus Sulfopaludibacter sp.]